MVAAASTKSGPDDLLPGGLEAVLLANRQAVLGFLRAHGAGDEAEDLLQDLWLKLATAPAAPVAQPLSYIYRAANNLMLDRYRSARQATQRNHAWSETRPEAEAATGERGLIARDQIGQVRATLAALGTRAEAIFRRHRLDGIPQRDLVSEFGVSLSTVESDLRRAYAALIELRQRFDDE